MSNNMGTRITRYNPTDILAFINRTGGSEDQAHFYLEATQGNLEAAIEMYQTTGGDAGYMAQIQRQNNNNNDNNNTRRSQVGEGRRQQENQTFIKRLLNGTRNILYGAIQLPMKACKISLSILGTITLFILKKIFTLIIPRSIREAYVRTNALSEPLRECEDFVRSFNAKYGDIRPHFVELQWKDAAIQANRESKFLFVYIHSPEHQDTDKFCRETLCSPEIVNFINRNFIAWGGDIRRSATYALSFNLAATTFPYMCLVAHVSSQTRLIVSIQGKTDSNQLLNILQRALNEQGALMVAERTEREIRENDRRLREEQDLQYQLGLEADRERERKKREAEELKRAEERARQLRAEEERLKKEEEERRKENRKEAVINRRINKKQGLKQEPSSDDKVSQIRIRLPNGSTHNRKFNFTDRVQDIYDYIDTLEGLESWEYDIVLSFPRKNFGNETKNKTLEEVGLIPSVMLFVQSHDD